MINDMGITVYEKASDVESTVLTDNCRKPTMTSAVEEAAAALATVDSEFGRTTDPVRMYMREMGTVELLTREGEIRIAKRIEEGLNQVKNALSYFPPTLELIGTAYAPLKAGTGRLQDLMSPLSIRMNRMRSVPASAKSDDDDEPEDLGPDPVEVVKRFDSIIRRHKRVLAAIENEGTGDAKTQRARDRLTAEIMEIKFAPKLFDLLIAESAHEHCQRARRERRIMALCVREAGMSRKEFIASFPRNETNLRWVDKHIRAKRKYSATLAKLKEEILRNQRRLIAIEEDNPSDHRRDQRDQSADVTGRGQGAACQERDG